MKRSLIASALLAGLAAIYAPVSQAQYEAGLQSVQLNGQFSAGAMVQMGTVDVYGFPVVGYACPSGAATCDSPRSGLLYNPNTVSGFSGALQVGSAVLQLHGLLLRFDNGDLIGWSTNIGASPFSKASPSSVLQSWNISYQNSTLGGFQIGSGIGVSAFNSLRDWYSRPARNLGVSDGGTFLIYPGASGQSTPFNYGAPGIAFSSAVWNGMSFDFSIGASVKQHRSVTDKSWVNELANTDSYKVPSGAYTTPPRAIQWSVAFNGYFRGIEGYLKPLAGQWMFSYAQSQQLNAPSIDEFRFKRAAHISFASIYAPLQSLNVVDLQWSQNTGVGVDGGFTQTLLEDLRLQSNFDAVAVKDFLGNDLGQLVKPVPYWNAALSWTTFHFGEGTTDMSWSFGYTRTQTYGYDYPGVALSGVANASSQLFNDPRLNSVYDNPILDYIAVKYLGVDASDASYPKDYQLMSGKLIAQSIYVGARYRYSSPYMPGLSLTLAGQLVYGKATLQLEGTPEQLAKGYSTKPFDLGTDLQTVLNLSVSYSF